MAIDSVSPMVAARHQMEDPQEFVASLLHTSEDRTAKGIAASVHRLITAGILRPGDRLPTVREISAQLGVSPATVSEAWQSLALVGALTTRGRAGTFVALATPGTGPTRFMGLGGPQSAVGLDLSRGTPDPALLPSLLSAVERVTRGQNEWSSSYFDEPVLGALEDELRRTWPFAPERITVVDGALDALSRIIDHVVSFGDRIVVESPGFPPLFDLLERAGAQMLAVSMDEQGIVPEELARALEFDPAAVFIQPRAQNPTGTSMTTLRSSELAQILSSSACWIIEDDHSGDIAQADDVSIGRYIPERCIHIRSYSKSHGPDLRIAALGGPSEVIEAIINRRMLGPGWTSRLLQGTLVELLTHAEPIAAVAHAREAYALRSTHLRESLMDRGIACSPGDGINVLVSVNDERSALVTLAAAGIRVAPGEPFHLSKNTSLTGNAPRSASVRVTSGMLSDHPGEIESTAQSIAIASLGVEGFDAHRR